MYLAKTYPKKESIYEHTDNLLKNLEILRDIYEENLDINWELLELACIYHDLGKVNRVFQKKLRSEGPDPGLPDIPHGYLSLLFINYRSLMEKGFKLEELVILINAVAHHHKRAELDDKIIEDIEDYYDYLLEDLENFSYDRMGIDPGDINKISLRLANKDGISGLPLELVEPYIMIKGLLNKIDYAASGHYRIEYRNDFLLDSMENLKEKWGEDSSFNELQNYMIKNREDNVIAIAETGYGKTEAGLLWIGDNKGFFTLPLKSAINQVYNRIAGDIVREDLEKRLGLLHSDTLAEYLVRNKNQLDRGVLDYQEITNELSMPLTVSTIDQIFDFVYKYVGFERKLASLAYSKIVIDEIQMYSSDLVAYIIIALQQIVRLGGKFAIITATFPPFIGDLLQERNIKFKMPEPFLHNERIRHSLKIERETINSDYIYSKFQDNKLLVIVNTVKKLNELYDELLEKYDLEEKVDVFHSGFIKKDRMKKEEELVSFGHKDSKKAGIWICTQVAEASLDIDFDILITELSDLNGLFQRMGRCYRSRNLDKDYNIYLFDGGEELTSGVGYINDRDIYEMSKKALRSRGDGPISEAEKIDLINKVYSSQALGDSNYYRRVLETIDYIDSIHYYEFRKKDVIKYFRNINSIDVIPRPVYEDARKEIDGLIRILSPGYLAELDREEAMIERKKARLELEKYKLSLAYYLAKEENIETIVIDEYNRLLIYNCDYSSSYGVKHLKDDETKSEDIFF